MASFVNPYENKITKLRRNFSGFNEKTRTIPPRSEVNKIILNLQNEIQNPVENNENSILHKIKKKSNQIKKMIHLKKSKDWDWENNSIKNDINTILNTQIKNLSTKLNSLHNIRYNKKSFNNVFNHSNINILSPNKRINLLISEPTILQEFNNYDSKNYSRLTHSEKIKYRNIFILILTQFIQNIIYDTVSDFLNHLNTNIESIFHNKSIQFKRYIHLLIYNDFCRKKIKIDTLYESNPFNESYMELNLVQKLDIYTNFIEEYLIKIIEPTEMNSFIYQDVIFNTNYVNNERVELPTPFSDTFDFRNRAFINHYTGAEGAGGAGAGGTGNENRNQETFLNTLEYIIENYFYEGINIENKERNISTHPTVVTNLKNKVRAHMYRYDESELDTILTFGKISFELENYIIQIPLPFMIHAILSNQGNDVSGLTKQFFSDLTKDINNTTIDEKFIINKSLLSIIKNNKIGENIKSRERNSGMRTYINNNSLNENNEAHIYRHMDFVPVIQKFLIKKMFEAPNSNKYKFKIVKQKREFNSVTRAFVVKNVESNAVQTRNSDYIHVLNKMITKKDDSIVNDYDLQILLFTIVLICCCSISRETRKKVYNPTGFRRDRNIRNFNVKILISKLPNGSLSLGYKIILAYYILTLIENYRSSGNIQMKAEQFNEYIFFLTIFYDNKALYNAIHQKNIESLKQIYMIYNKHIIYEEMNDFTFEFLLDYFKKNYVAQFIEKYTKEIGLNNFNKLLDFYGYNNIYTFMKSHFEGDLVTAESIIRNRSVRINPVSSNVSNGFYIKIMDKFINSLNKKELYIFSKFITGNILNQPYYYFNIDIPTNQTITSIRSATCHNTLYTSLIPLSGRNLTNFNNHPQVVDITITSLNSGTRFRKKNSTIKSYKKDLSIDNIRTIYEYNESEKALYDYYILNKDRVIEIMSEGISSFGFA